MPKKRNNFSPTQKQIEFAADISYVLDIPFPHSSHDYTKRAYSNFIKTNIDNYYYELGSINEPDDYDFDIWDSLLPQGEAF